MTLSYNKAKSVVTTGSAAEAHPSELREALALRREGDDLVGVVHEGWDVFGVPHGGYLTALAAAAALTASEQPDLFTLSVHFLRKAEVGPMRFSVEPVGASRRFVTLHAIGRQGDRVVLSAMISVGDRSQLAGPTWRAEPPWEPAALSVAAGEEGLSFTPPNIAKRMALRLDPATMAFAEGPIGADGRASDRAVIRGVAHLRQPDVFAALVACDLTPPAIWNALGAKGWIPTVELTAHVRASPVAGPLRVVASTSQLTDGFLEEDALVHDAAGRLIVQSRQLARWTGT